MDNEAINLTMQFLKRVDLKGEEVPAFNKCVSSLHNLAEENNAKEKKDDKNKDA